MRKITVKPFAFTLALILTIMLLQSTYLTLDGNVAHNYDFSDKIQTYSQENSDIQGWVYVGGTNINYPVVFYTPDVYYYLSRGYQKQYSRNGVIWADPLTLGGSRDTMSQNSVLFGHNWTNVSATPRTGNQNDVMFAQLPSFHYLDFAKENQFIHYATSEDNFVFQIFAVFYTDISFVYNRCDPTAEQFRDIITTARSKSLHQYDVEVSNTDRIITLSTCTRAYGASDRQRFVVMGKMVPAGTEAVSVISNPNRDASL